MGREKWQYRRRKGERGRERGGEIGRRRDSGR